MFTRSLIFGVVIWVSVGFCAMGQGGMGAWAADGRGMGMAMPDAYGDLQAQLEATDEEWSVLRPKIEAVTAARSELNAGMMGRGMGMGRNNSGTDGELARLRRELMEMLSNPSMLPVDYANKIRAIRDARKMVQMRLTAAQNALIDILTPKQEAILMQRGILD